jgi:hypothetical protein
MVKPIELSKSEVEKTPYLVWNSFIHLIALSEYKDLTNIQMTASLAFNYDSEVQNGGHLQYFENTAKIYPNQENLLINATVDALKYLGAIEQEKILSSASKIYYSQDRKHPKTVEEYCATALEEEFGDFDNSYYETEPSITNLLEKYLEVHLTEFVKII